MLRPFGIINFQDDRSMYDHEPTSREDGVPGKFLSLSRGAGRKVVKDLERYIVVRLVRRWGCGLIGCLARRCTEIVLA